MLIKHEQVFIRKLLSLFNFGKLFTKKDHFGVFFKFFSDSLKLKRPLSMHLTLDRKKIHEGQYGVFFKLFLDSLILKRPLSITIFGLKNQSTEKGYHASFYFSFSLVKTWKGGKKGGKDISSMASIHYATLEHGIYCINILQLGYPLPMSHYHLYESSYSIDWLLFRSSMVSVLVITALYQCFWSNKCYQVNAFVLAICSWDTSLCWSSVVLLTFQVGHPYVRFAHIVLSLHTIFLC